MDFYFVYVSQAVDAENHIQMAKVLTKGDMKICRIPTLSDILAWTEFIHVFCFFWICFRIRNHVKVVNDSDKLYAN